MEKVYNWKARQQSGVIKIYGTDARGVSIIIPEVVEIRHGRTGFFGRKPPVARCRNGSEYVLV